MKEGEERQGFAEGRAVRAWREGWQDRRGRLPGVKVQTMGARVVCWGEGQSAGQNNSGHSSRKLQASVMPFGFKMQELSLHWVNKEGRCVIVKSGVKLPSGVAEPKRQSHPCAGGKACRVLALFPRG